MRRFLLFALTLAAAAVSHGQQTVIWTTGTYVYDGVGNIRSIGTDKYSYDSMGRLKTANLTFPGGAATQTFTYDGFGNLTSIDTTPNLPTYLKTEPIPVSAATNQLTGRTYDAAGNLTVDGVEAYEWDATGSMIARRVTGEEDWLYLYTASDERIAVFRGELKSAGQSGFVTSPTKASWTIRDLDAKPMAVWESSGGTYGLATMTWKRDYVWGFGRLMATIDATGTRHVHTDHLGTPRLITNAQGAIVEEHEYYPFGFEATTEGSEPLKFTGHERDLEPYSVNDLDHMHARYYSPVMGRFLSVDPRMTIGRNLRSPQRWNRYSYALNNPMLRLDPDGQADLTFMDMLGIAGETLVATIDDIGFIIASPGLEIQAGILQDDPVRMAKGQAMIVAEAASGPLLRAGTGALGSRLAMMGNRVPTAANEKLQGVITQLFKGTDNVAGGTAGAIRQELATGVPVGTRGFHFQKGFERLRQLEKLISSGNLSADDLKTAQALADDLKDALKPLENVREYIDVNAPRR